jgi:hypothetical protein
MSPRTMRIEAGGRGQAGAWPGVRHCKSLFLSPHSFSLLHRLDHMARNSRSRGLTMRMEVGGRGEPRGRGSHCKSLYLPRHCFPCCSQCSGLIVRCSSRHPLCLPRAQAIIADHCFRRRHGIATASNLHPHAEEAAQRPSRTMWPGPHNGETRELPTALQNIVSTPSLFPEPRFFASLPSSFSSGSAKRHVPVYTKTGILSMAKAAPAVTNFTHNGCCNCHDPRGAHAQQHGKVRQLLRGFSDRGVVRAGLLGEQPIAARLAYWHQVSGAERQ